ncbi:MAG: NUDIX hydrolase [Verrucomicrobia bacterium]|nr:NUDIX hydrolase [Verrucomicrobiota bacterium]
MKFWMIFLCLSGPLSFLVAEENQERVNRYLEFLESNKKVLGSLGNYKKGEIQIVTAPKLLTEIQEVCKIRYQKNGLSEKEALLASRVGVLSEDPFWIVVRDAVIFPTGAYGVYNRLILKSSLLDNCAVAGSAILPVLENGKIILILNYRHASRSWELEMPRGFRQPKETVEETVTRELQEETGLRAISIKPLGEVALDTGALNAIVPVFLVIGKKQGISNQDFSEAILRSESFTLLELKEGFKRGFMTLEINGTKQEVPLRDPFLSFALFQAENKGLLP